MPDTFEFTIAKPSITLGADRTGSVPVEVTSRLGRHGVVGAEVQPGEGADAAWFAAPAPAEFDLPDGETLRTTIAINVPADAPAGDYQFGVRAYAIDNPQQDFTNSPSISMTVPEPKIPRKGIPKWIFIVIAIVLALIIAGVLFVVLSGDDEATVPNVVNASAQSAQQTLDDAGLDSIVTVEGPATGLAKCLIVSEQDPIGGTKIADLDDDNVDLTLVWRVCRGVVLTIPPDLVFELERGGPILNPFELEGGLILNPDEE